jgi:2-iminobutanoate/2-iminopropanoate deaminase
MADGERVCLQPIDAHAPGADVRSHAIVADGVVYVPAQVGVNPSGTLLDGFECQISQAFETLSAVLAAFGVRLTDVVTVRAFIRDISDVATYRRLRDLYLPHRPVSVHHAPNTFAVPSVRVAIAAIAVPSSIEPR